MTSQNTVSLSTRIISIVLDYFIMGTISSLLFIPVLIKSFVEIISTSHDASPLQFLELSMYALLFGAILFTSKDIANGRSIGKRITNLQVVDHKTGRVASPLQGIVRSLFCVFGLLEVIVTCINPSRRIGDHVAGTCVVPYNPITTKQPRVNPIVVMAPLIISYVLIFMLGPSFSFPGFTPKGFPSSTHVESSYNDTASKSLEAMLSKELGHLLTATVNVYDSVEHQTVKYISIRCNLKENYLENQAQYEKLRQQVEGLLYARYPKDSITSEIYYTFKSKSVVRQSTLKSII
jgi:uncharacterized RDD family membrane protein YckC